MSNTYKSIAVGLGAVIIGGFAIFSNTSNGQTITVTDDGKKILENIEVRITEPKTILVFNGTLGNVDAILDTLYKQRSAINTEIVKHEAIRATMVAELDKLPAREK